MRIGIDLGGTKIECVVLDDFGQIKHRQRVATPQGQYLAIIKSVVGLVDTAEQQHGCSMSVGIGTPGALSPISGFLRNSNSVCLNGKPVHQDFEQALARSVRIANDADCFALSEAVDGAAQNKNLVFAVIAGTGVGGGIVLNQQLLKGPNAVTGEWGHNPLPWQNSDDNAGDCYCGKQGCIETFLSGAGLQNNYFNVSNQNLACEEIVSLADAGDSLAERALSVYESQMARALASIINILDPDVIVLGGGMSNIDRLYNNVPKYWNEYAFTEKVLTLLCKAEHGDSSGVRGAAWLWPVNC